MNHHSSSLAVYALGILCLAAGIMLRFRAAALGAAALAGGPGKMMEGMMNPQTGGYSNVTALAQYSNAMYDVAHPLLWTGGALIVVASVARLFLPAWLARGGSPEKPASLGAEHPALSDLP